MSVLDRGVDESTPVLIFGYGQHGRAVQRALAARDVPTRVVDDRPDEATLRAASDSGVDLVVAPDDHVLARLVESADAVVPTPGLPERHRLFSMTAAAGRPILGEFDLARMWDDRPIVAITGTNGKTTVTTMVTQMFVADRRRAVAAGNLELPLVSAIADAATEIFVVEASSFRLGHVRQFAPAVGTWLNFAPDHLDVHLDLGRYERAKAAIWRDQSGDDVAVANAEDPIVMRNVPDRRRTLTFGLSNGDNRVVGEVLMVDGRPLLEIPELFRSLPHDRANALAAATTAIAGGASRQAVGSILRTFEGLAHRVQLVGDDAGIRWYDDSKATSPHAVLAGVSGFASTVLIAGGRNKGLDLSPLAMLAPRLRAVVAIGEAAGEVAAVFEPLLASGRRVVRADSMGDAVARAGELAVSGDAVVLSPGCTSYDWYSNYGERGDDFARIVRALITGGAR